MRFGVLALSPGQVETAAKAGYDSAELHVSTIMELSDSGFKDTKALLSGAGIPVEVFHEPLPSEIQICKKGFNTFVWREYIKNACFRVSELGGKVFLFRNGFSRSLPIEGDMNKARISVRTFIVMLCEIAHDYDITVAMEPLEVPRSNIYNTLDDCAELIQMLQMPNLVSMYSLRHSVNSDGAFEALKTHGDIIKHALIDNPTSPHTKSRCPNQADGYDYITFLKGLDETDYDGTLTVSAAVYDDFESEITGALKLFKTER